MKTGITPTKEMGKLVVALYSVSQDCFHVEQLCEYIELNIKNGLLRVNTNDYKMIGVFNSDIEAGGYIETFKSYLKIADNNSIDGLINNALNDKKR